jgi:hypothetical protein
MTGSGRRLSKVSRLTSPAAMAYTVSSLVDFWTLVTERRCSAPVQKLGGMMPSYRLYRLNAANKIIDAIDFDGPDIDSAKAEAVRIDHAEIIEIWCGARMVARVNPNQLKA